MTAKTRPIQRIFTLFLLMLLLINVLPLNALASDSVYEGEIELNGRFNRKFELSSSDMELFNLEGVVPGDTWKGKLHVKNSGRAKMEIAIISIASNLGDNTLYDALDLNIRLGDEEIYSGSYGATAEPISEFYEIPKGEKITFDIVVTLPKTTGNYVQNKEMDSTWTFEGRYYGSNSNEPLKGDGEAKYTVYYVDDDGNELLEKKVGVGEIDSKVTEYAPDIDGYTPDEEVKSIVLRTSDNTNVIIFVYSQTEGDTTPATPEDPPSDSTEPPASDPEPGEPTTPPTELESKEPPTDNDTPSDSKVPTGYDMTESNSLVDTWLLVLSLCVLCGAIIFFRIQREKKRVNKAKNLSKEATTNDEK